MILAKLKRDRSPEEVLTDYQEDVKRWRKHNAHYKEIQPLKIADVLIIKQALHPTNKQQSKDLTKELILYLCDKTICTAGDIYNDLGYSDKPILKRLKMFQQFGLVRRESKKWYLPTPRLEELKKRYLRRICS